MSVLKNFSTVLTISGSCQWPTEIQVTVYVILTLIVLVPSTDRPRDKTPQKDEVTLGFLPPVTAECASSSDHRNWRRGSWLAAALATSQNSKHVHQACYNRPRLGLKRQSLGLGPTLMNFARHCFLNQAVVQGY